MHQTELTPYELIILLDKTAHQPATTQAASELLSSVIATLRPPPDEAARIGYKETVQPLGHVIYEVQPTYPTEPLQREWTKPQCAAIIDAITRPPRSSPWLISQIPIRDRLIERFTLED